MNGQQAGKFFVTGLPRSRTAWMSAFLSTGETLCLHEPCCLISQIDQLPAVLDTTFYKHMGFADSGLGFHIEWILENLKPRTLIIERDVAEVEESFRKAGLVANNFYYCDLLAQTLLEFRDHPLVKWVHFNSLGHKRVMQDIYWWLMPGMAFDEARYEQFSSFNIEVNLERTIERAYKSEKNLESLFRDTHETLREMSRASA